jgi:two-component system, OmpR family, alkaline phosphatase synthesis response regulator PhoP
MGKSKILVVDDEPDIVETLAFMLQARNFDVITASGGLEGLAKVRSEHPDLTLLDIMMPGMDGYDVCIKLKKDKDTQNMPVIMLTAKGENEAVIRAHKSGADDYIVKPFNLPTLVSKLNRLLDRQ